MEEALTSSMKKMSNSSVLTDMISSMVQKDRNVDSLKKKWLPSGSSFLKLLYLNDRTV